MQDLVQNAETSTLLPSNHFSCRPSMSTTDSLHFVMKYVKDAWRNKNVVSVLFLHIKSAFPSVVLSQLVHDMRVRGVPRQYTNWVAHKVGGHRTTLKFDGYKSEPLSLTKGIDQGFPL